MPNMINPFGGHLGPVSAHARKSGELVTNLAQAVMWQCLHGTAPVPALLKEVIHQGAWREFALRSIIIHTYPTFKAFVEDWLLVEVSDNGRTRHATIDDLKAICTAEHDQEALRMLDEAIAQNPSVVKQGEQP